MNNRIFGVVIVSLAISACGGGGGSSLEKEESSGFSVPTATGSDGLDKAISLMNVQSNSQVFHGVGGSVNSTRGELSNSVGCSEGERVSRRDFPQATSITSDQVCFGTECATSQNNSYLVTDAAAPDIRFDYVYFFGSSLEVAMDTSRFEIDAGRDQSCNIDGPTPAANFPTSIDGTYKGFVYRRNGDSLDRSSAITLSCTESICSVDSDVIVADTIELAPEGTPQPRFIWESISIRFANGEAQKRYNGILSASPGGDIVGGVGIPLDQFRACYEDCVTIALEKQ
ncbi:hypothetical protein [Marinobacter nauticus]|uniref:hypothetical protein n=1 Tax=Marinobacter nauticus TaxID=2743 RepID=UPI001160CC3B|nr:hypothetical protein [Marinobacter nauticus]